MHSTHRSVVLASVALLACATTACSSDDGKPSGSSSGVVPTADGGDEAAAGEAGAKKANAAICATSEECLSALCFVGGTQSYCAITCTPETATMLCTPPFTGACNKQGYCKRD